ncbi:hypothetical protein HUJ05_000139 [Dendroctonus ponderosae]|nr:hypothetical protein HUJ05_000121 [Dendroctonus ponderosae]KAH1026473.1 hypothetical protein HUJ05_000139 [Dendroctonus ponderosae]
MLNTKNSARHSNISAVFIYQWKGEELVNLSQNDSNVYVHITIAGHSGSKSANINSTCYDPELDKYRESVSGRGCTSK